MHGHAQFPCLYSLCVKPWEKDHAQLILTNYRLPHISLASSLVNTTATYHSCELTRV